MIRSQSLDGLGRRVTKNLRDPVTEGDPWKKRIVTTETTGRQVYHGSNGPLLHII